MPSCSASNSRGTSSSFPDIPVADDAGAAADVVRVTFVRTTQPEQIECRHVVKQKRTFGVGAAGAVDEANLQNVVFR
jgi:hypothetical protein